MSWEQALGAFFAIALGGFSLASFAEAWRKFRLVSRGLWVEAEIVRVREVKGSGDDSLFHPVVAFTLTSGERIEAESPAGKPYPPGLTSSPGSKVDVLYDPARPTRIEFPGYEGDGVLKSLLLGVVLAGGAALVFSAMVV
jgi:hypothetical protein